VRASAAGSAENARVMGMVKAGDATNDGPIEVNLVSVVPPESVPLKELAMNALAEPITPSTDEMPAPLIFTDSAADKVRQLVEEEGNPDLKLRVFVQGGGCSGFQYGFTFDEVINEDDTQMAKNGVMLLIDAMSLQYLMGAEIDYKEDLQGAQFVIKNPNATTTCGCGSSFTA
jgi:iron-sulfur cluster insertion protein